MRPQPLTLLLIEDDDHDAELFTSVLHEVSPDVSLIRAQDADSTFKQLGAWQHRLPSLLILLDLHLPDQHGHAVLEHLKTHPQLRHVPVVVFSTSDALEDINRSYHLHANGYLTKPADLGGYLDLIQTMLRYWQTAAHLPA